MPIDKDTIKDVATLKSQMEEVREDIADFKEERAEWQTFCVKLVLKTGITLLSLITLGAFWGYLSPEAKQIIEKLIK